MKKYIYLIGYCKFDNDGVFETKGYIPPAYLSSKKAEDKCAELVAKYSTSINNGNNEGYYEHFVEQFYLDEESE